ncbi:hypothetical protein CFOL_v3_09261 [Cephalotus follicularis]|uniref:Uncharacterized protein n=1 Tax=Cephalotus follicularis TaxID=3775 RepID=A0A1Q3BCI3_CEPFO|nr:hypothetical protein CFOL_v3_09261 [Cephalotus follicularis]
MLPSIKERKTVKSVFHVNITPIDWRFDIIEYLKNPSQRVKRGLKILALNYCLYDGELYRKGQDGLLLICLGFEGSIQVMMEVHEGTCGPHQSGLKMRWLIGRHGCFLLVVLNIQNVSKHVKGTMMFRMSLRLRFFLS